MYNLHEAVRGFTGKLSLFNVHAESGNLLHFPFTREVCGEDEERTEGDKQVLVSMLESRLPAFDDRLVDFVSTLLEITVKLTLIA